MAAKDAQGSYSKERGLKEMILVNFEKTLRPLPRYF